MKLNIIKFILLTILMMVVSLAKADINIGVLSHRGEQETLKTWSSLADYLNTTLIDYQFRIVPLTFEQVDEETSFQNIDFLLVNPGIYVDMEVKHRVSRLVTLNKEADGKLLNVFGGVIFVKKRRDDINSIKDIVGKRFLAVDGQSLGGFQMAWRELNKNGINPYQDTSLISFAGTHDKVVMGVKNGYYDVGTVRTGILEKMAKAGSISMEDFKIINETQIARFPYRLSSQLYPEWPFSKLQHTPTELAQEVAVALLQMKTNFQPFQMLGYRGWSVALDYQEVHDLFIELNIPPYGFSTNLTLGVAIEKYWQWLLSAIIFLIIFGIMSARIFQLNKQLRITQYELEQRHDMVLNSVCDGIYGVDLDGNCTFINKAMETLTGWTGEDIIKKNQHAIMHHTHRDGSPHLSKDCPVYHTFMDNQPRFIEDDVFWKKNGESFPVEYSSTPIKDQMGQTIGSVVVFRDISERKMIEEKDMQYRADLSHVSRLNTLGGMATGLAHELNQPLTAIATNAFAAIQLIEADNTDREQLIDIMEKTNQHAERAGNIIRHLRSLSKKDSSEYSWVNINDLVKGVLTLLKHEIKKLQVKLRLNLDDSLPPVYCQSIQIDQVILNLCKNALEVLEKNVPGDRQLSIHSKLKQNGFVQVAIEDNGKGVEKGVLDELFEPFISNKSEGMGLGLSICKNIIEAHMGELYLLQGKKEFTELDHTIFVFELPYKQSSNISGEGLAEITHGEKI
ncbi:MAG: PhnD/SsuA/transferrin family substrate-binding protein [Gammaproteobacteria bacterium]|nr:PhnD/SsuA/transferrin family substrate-binding protein [Gammaproteobacteria bacterium]